MLSTLIERIRLYEVMIMSSFQTHFSFLEPLFLGASNLGDPVNGYLFFFIFCLIFVSHSSAFKILWTSLLAEWINLELKWLFNDQRPYWWSQQVKHYLRSRNDTQFFTDINTDHDFQRALSVLDLKQFSVTCETGPGFPSGHVMCSAAVWFCLIIQLIKYKVLRSPKQRLFLRTIFISSLIMVALGRIYISAHFPDQCFVGLLTGIIVTVIIEKTVDIQSINFFGHLILSLLLLGIAYITHELMNRYSQKSADWSLTLAKKYCYDINNVRADTTPLFVVWRTAGCAIGIGVAFNLLLVTINKNNYLSLTRSKVDSNVRTINAIVSTVSVVIFYNYSKPEANFGQIYNFYVKSFIQFLFIPIVGLLSVLLIDKIIKFYLNRVFRKR